MSNSTSDTASSQDFDASTSYTGRVKWFNNKAGYGVITVCRSSSDDKVGEDVFAHHSGIVVSAEQYKYLVQGEYVDFHLRKSDSSDHPYQACDLTGVAGGKLMCETRWETRQARDAENEGADDEQSSRPKRAKRQRSGDRNGGRQRVRLHGTGPRDGETWTLNIHGGSQNNSRRRQNAKVRRDEDSA
jgi:cold shock CspA family protein